MVMKHQVMHFLQLKSKNSENFFNKFSKLTQNTKTNAIFVHVKTTY